MGKKQKFGLQCMLELGRHDLVEFKIPSGVLSWELQFML